jgi:hypothetical protein
MWRGVLYLLVGEARAAWTTQSLDSAHNATRGNKRKDCCVMKLIERTGYYWDGNRLQLTEKEKAKIRRKVRRMFARIESDDRLKKMLIEDAPLELRDAYDEIVLVNIPKS